MLPRHTSRAFGGIACLLLTTTVSAAHAITLDRVRAIVDDDIVLESEVRARAATHRDLSPAEARAQALAELIDAVLLAKEAQRRKLTVLPTEIDRAVAEMRAVNRLDTKEFDIALEAAGFDMASYRGVIGEQILGMRVFEQVAASRALPFTASIDERRRAHDAWMAELRAEAFVEPLARPIERAPLDTRERIIQEIVVTEKAIRLALPSTLFPGAKADPALIARAARSVWATGLLADLSFELDDKGVLLVVGKPLPVFHELLINGAPPTAASIRRLGVVPGSPINPARLHAGLRQWRRDQQRLGYYWTEVQDTLRPASKDAVDIVVTVQEGPLAAVDVRFTGNEAIDRKVLVDALVYEPRELLDPSFLEYQARALQMLYYDHGFVTAEVVGAIEPSLDRRRVTVNFLVKREGARHTLGPITIEGAAGRTAKTTPTALGLVEGATFDRSAVLEAIQRLQRSFEAAGRGYLAVDFDTKLDGTKVALTFRTSAGLPAPRFGAIAVLGQTRGDCRPAELASALARWTDETFSTSALASIRATIERTCKIVVQTRDTAPDARDLQLHFLVTHR